MSNAEVLSTLSPNKSKNARRNYRNRQNKKRRQIKRLEQEKQTQQELQQTQQALQQTQEELQLSSFDSSRQMTFRLILTTFIEANPVQELTRRASTCRFFRDHLKSHRKPEPIPVTHSLCSHRFFKSVNGNDYATRANKSYNRVTNANRLHKKSAEKAYSQSLSKAEWRSIKQ